MTTAIEFGYATIRNEDGTQYLSSMDGVVGWSDDRRDRKKISRQVFEILESMVEDSKKTDCPDNGFFGWYNLTFTAWK